MEFPTVSGRGPRGARLTVPNDLDGEQTLVVVVFHRRQRSLVRSWRQFAEELWAEFDHFAYYELVVSETSRMVPPAGRGGLSPTGLEGRRRDTVRISVDKTVFQRRLGMLGKETIYALLREGDDVVRREAGMVTLSVRDGLESLLESYRDAARRQSNGAEETGEPSG